MPIALAPPHFISQPNRTWHLRGIVQTAFVAQTITATQLAAFLGLIVITPTTSSFLADGFRLSKIACWAPVATAGTPVTVMMKFADDPASNTQVGAPKTQTDTSISFDRPAYCCLKPPKDNTSIFSQWQDSSLATAWINVSWPLGTVVDLFYNWFLDDQGAVSGGPTIAGGTPGTVVHKTILIAGGANGTLGVVTPMNSI